MSQLGWTYVGHLAREVCEGFHVGGPQVTRFFLSQTKPVFPSKAEVSSRQLSCKILDRHVNEAIIGTRVVVEGIQMDNVTSGKPTRKEK